MDISTIWSVFSGFRSGAWSGGSRSWTRNGGNFWKWSATASSARPARRRSRCPTSPCATTSASRWPNWMTTATTSRWRALPNLPGRLAVITKCGKGDSTRRTTSSCRPTRRRRSPPFCFQSCDQQENTQILIIRESLLLWILSRRRLNVNWSENDFPDNMFFVSRIGLLI